MGSYDNQEMRLLPFATPRFPVAGTKPVYIDRCILPDIEALWALGIETVESCCGHGQTNGYIIVVPSAVVPMRALGYGPDPRKPDRNDLFGWPQDERV